MYISAVPDNLKEVAKNSKPSIEISNSGNSWTIKTTVSDKVKDTTFNIGEEFDSQSLTGQPLKVEFFSVNAIPLDAAKQYRQKNSHSSVIYQSFQHTKVSQLCTSKTGTLSIQNLQKFLKYLSRQFRTRLYFSYVPFCT